MPHHENNKENETIADLQQLVRVSFPAETFLGNITPANENTTPELDDSRALYDGLHGKNWTEIPKEFVCDYPREFVLLTDEAFKAFIAAWLMYSLEGPENSIRDYVVFGLSPMHDMLPDTTPRTLLRLAKLNGEQRQCLKAILSYFGKMDPSAFIRTHAYRAIALLEEL